MKSLWLSVVLTLGMSASALAADLDAQPYTKAPSWIPATYDWSGFYVGFNGGGGWSHKCWTNTNTLGFAVVPTAEGCHNANGGFVGGQFTYRWQVSNWVFGFEGQGDWADLKGANDSLFVPGLTNETRVDAFGLLTGHVGYAWDKVLWYVKGGAAVVNDKYHGVAAATGTVFDTADEIRWGGAVGTGVEVSFAPNWSVGVEYNHLFMGTHSVDFLNPTGAASRTDSIKQGMDIAQIRLNYRWNGPVIPKY